MSAFLNGLTLSSISLAGSANYIIDTTKNNSWFKYINYNGVFFDVASSSLSAKIAVSNNDFSFPNFTYIQSGPVSSLNLSGRYLNIVFEFKRTSLSAVVPKIRELKVNFDYSESEFVHKEIYKTKSDIFGNHYALLKEENNLDIYNKKLQNGEYLIKLTTDKVDYLYNVLIDEYTKYESYQYLYPNLYNEMLSGVKDFELFYDTLMSITNNYIVIEKLIFDYDSKKLVTDPTNFHVIDLSSNNYTYSDVWFFEYTKDLIIFLTKKTYTNTIRTEIPKSYILNIGNSNFKNLEILDTNNKLNNLTSLSVVNFERPVLTYNDLTKNFNMSYIFYDSASGLNIASYSMDYRSDNIYINNISVITPVKYD